MRVLEASGSPPVLRGVCRLLLLPRARSHRPAVRAALVPPPRFPVRSLLPESPEQPLRAGAGRTVLPPPLLLIRCWQLKET
ncbi:hypothetical protein NDU88_005659 [Pleurodeles waltl]|uniref:Uncharacterized protein n=1 Tax=Pleurodeles waltl TaxID=8319 RepID=A0AAV7WCJ8_PLEWA|nr:hypothetical protein NDU88_005659 [Pleurodeles waltl]